MPRTPETCNHTWPPGHPLYGEPPCGQTLAVHLILAGASITCSAGHLLKPGDRERARRALALEMKDSVVGDVFVDDVPPADAPLEAALSPDTDARQAARQTVAELHARYAAFVPTTEEELITSLRMRQLTPDEWGEFERLLDKDGAPDDVRLAVAAGCAEHGNAGMDWDEEGAFCVHCGPRWPRCDGTAGHPAAWCAPCAVAAERALLSDMS